MATDPNSSKASSTQAKEDTQQGAKEDEKQEADEDLVSKSLPEPLLTPYGGGFTFSRKSMQ